RRLKLSLLSVIGAHFGARFFDGSVDFFALEPAFLGATRGLGLDAGFGRHHRLLNHRGPCSQRGCTVVRLAAVLLGRDDELSARRETIGVQSLKPRARGLGNPISLIEHETQFDFRFGLVDVLAAWARRAARAYIQTP